MGMASPKYFDSTQPVNFGQKSSDEMMMGFVMAAPVIAADQPEGQPIFERNN